MGPGFVSTGDLWPAGRTIREAERGNRLAFRVDRQLLVVSAWGVIGRGNPFVGCGRLDYGVLSGLAFPIPLFLRSSF